jgi:hypothetical protein
MVAPDCSDRENSARGSISCSYGFRLVFFSFPRYNTIQHVGVSQTRLLPSILIIAYPSSSIPPYLHPSSTICRQARTMKNFTPESRLKILNERLSTNTAKPSTLGKPFIKFTCKETWINNDLCIKFQGAGTSAKTNRGKDSSKALRNTRPQNNICIKFRGKQGNTSIEQEFYPDVVVMGSTTSASKLECEIATASTSATPNKLINTGQRCYCKSIGVSAKAHSPEG